MSNQSAFDLRASEENSVWSSSKGNVSLQRLGAAVVLISMSGRVEAAASPSLARALDQALRAQGKMHTFWDLERLAWYHSSIRTESVKALLRHRANVAAVNALATASIVKMGVAVANLALGNRIQSFAQRPPFEAALKRALQST